MSENVLLYSIFKCLNLTCRIYRAFRPFDFYQIWSFSTINYNTISRSGSFILLYLIFHAAQFDPVGGRPAQLDRYEATPDSHTGQLDFRERSLFSQHPLQWHPLQWHPLQWHPLQWHPHTPQTDTLWYPVILAIKIAFAMQNPQLKWMIFQLFF